MMMIITTHSPSRLTDSREAWTSELDQLNQVTLNGVHEQLMHPAPSLPAELCIKQLSKQMREKAKQQQVASPAGSRNPVRWYRKYWTRGEGGGYRDRLLCRLSLFMIEQQRNSQRAKRILIRRIHCVRHFINEYSTFTQSN